MARRPSLPTPAPLRHRAERHAHRGLLTHRSVADALISLAGIVGQPVRNQAGDEVGRVADVVARWDGGPYPPATGLVVKVGRRPAFLPIAQVATMKADEVRLRSARLDLRDFQRRPGEVVLGRDVLDRQLVDVDGVRVVRASDLYLARVGLAWRLVGVDVELPDACSAASARPVAATAPRPTACSTGRPSSPSARSPASVRLLAVQPGPQAPPPVGARRPARGARARRAPGAARRRSTRDVAADALEEMEPEELEHAAARGAEPARAAALVAEMEPDEAADALRDLEPRGAGRAARRHARRRPPATLAALLTFSEESAGGLMTTHLVTRARSAPSVQAVRDRLRAARPTTVPTSTAVLVIDDDGTPRRRPRPVRPLPGRARRLGRRPRRAALARHRPRRRVARGGRGPPRRQPRRSSVVVVDDADRPVGRILADDVVDALVPERAKLRFPRILA